jgi:hypothetical protein
VSSFFTLARAASETKPIKAASQSPTARTDRQAKHDPVSGKFKTVTLSVHGTNRPLEVGQSMRWCSASRTSAEAVYGFSMTANMRASACRLLADFVAKVGCDR